MKTLFAVAVLFGVADTANAGPLWHHFNADAASRTPYALSDPRAAEEPMHPQHDDFGSSSAQNVARTLGYQ